MKTTALIGLILTVASAHVCADNLKYVCSRDGGERVIEVAYTGEGKVPCEVRYTKAEGTETLWSANGEEGYCETKAQDFVETQRGWGWTCTESAAAPAAAQEAAPESAAPAAN